MWPHYGVWETNLINKNQMIPIIQAVTKSLRLRIPTTWTTTCFNPCTWTLESVDRVGFTMET